MKLKTLLFVLLIVALLCPAALMEEGLNEPLPVSEEAVVTDSAVDAAEPDGETVSADSADSVSQDSSPDTEDEEQPEDSAPVDSAEGELIVESVDEAVPEVGFEEDYELITAEMGEPLDFVSDDAADAALTASGEISIDSTNFPDANFRSYISFLIDKDKNGILSIEEREQVTYISIPWYAQEYKNTVKEINNLRFFPNLSSVDWSGGQLTTLDASGCTNLTHLRCQQNPLTTLNVDNCHSLEYLWCMKTELTALDVSGLQSLKDLDCRESTLKLLNASGCKSLETITCSSNSQLEHLNVNGCEHLYELYCSSCNLSSLDVSSCSQLYELNCEGNQLHSLDVSSCAQLYWLDCEGNQLHSLDVSGCDFLGLLDCDDNLLETLNVSHCQKLEYLSCGNNRLTSLDLSDCDQLWSLWCEYNQLGSLDLSNKADLHCLDCSYNNITSLDITACEWLLYIMNDGCRTERGDTFIEYTDVPGYWELSDLDFLSVLKYDKGTTIIPENEDIVSIDPEHFPDAVFRNYVKEEFDANKNDIICKYETYHARGIYLGPDRYDEETGNRYYQSYNVTSLKGIEYFPYLRSLYCEGNQLTSLDISKNRDLKALSCYDNKITSLDITGCPMILEIVNSNQYSISDDNKTITYGEDEWDSGFLKCDTSVQIIGKAYVPQANVPSTTNDSGNIVAPAIPTIPAVKKSGKFQITAAPGSVYQLDLGGTTGKAFKSSKKKVATVDASGNVTIKGAGKTKITFKAGKKKRTLTLTVKDPTIPASVTITPVNTAVKVGDAITLTPVIPANTNSAFKWKSSNKKVAKVVNGVVTFRKPGKVTVTCTAVRGKKKAKVTFKVSK